MENVRERAARGSGPPTRGRQEAMPPGKELFRVEDLCAGYGRGFALKNISFSVEEGSLTGVLGANGSGKTTLLRAICQQMKHEGSCRLTEVENDFVALENISARQLARRVSYIPQQSGITVQMDVLDVVLMGFNPVLGILQNPSREQCRQAENALVALGLEGYGRRNYLSLSEGQKQLVILARTLVEDSRLLILDEPDSALDFSNRHGVMGKILALVKGHKKAAILSLHDPMLALKFCDKLILIKDGQCVGQVRPDIDQASVVEAVLRQIYGPVSLTACEGKDGTERLVLLWDF